MNYLDDVNFISKLDKSNLLGSIQDLELQLKQTVVELSDLKVPSNYKNIKNVVVNGMGGSRLGARVAQRLFSGILKVPINPIGSYKLPAYVDQNTLLILSSYSGNTEEVLETLDEAIKRKCKIMVYSQNGKLSEIAKNNNFPGYYGFDPKHNPCNQPRMSIGYQILGIMLMLSKAGLLTLSSNEINKTINFLKERKKLINSEIPTKENIAKQLAVNLQEKILVLISAEHIMGALHVWRNQTNENAKQLAIYFEIPELNHHLLEGLKFPKENFKNLYFIFLSSKLFVNKNQNRINVTKKVLDKYKIQYKDILLVSKTKFTQVFETIQLGSFIGFYLSILNNINPSPIPWVDYFKKELKKIR